MRRLSECRILAKRLSENKYDQFYYDRHEEKWGKLNIDFTASESKDLFVLNSSRKNVITKADKRQELLDLKLIQKIEYKMIRLETERLFYLLSKYINKFWD